MKLKQFIFAFTAMLLCFAVSVNAQVAKIGGTEYTTLADALNAAKAKTGDVTVELYEKVTLNQPLNGSFTTITFVGKDTDAEIYLDVQGYITATGKKVSFTDLKLSKSEGGFITNAGFMNVAFGIYDVVEVTYDNCTFLNGACASSGKVTFNSCTFKKSWDKYALWVYGNVDVTVQGSTFADYRGIKMYAENGAAASVEKANLTVKNTNFSAVDNKPAIVLTYGESVVLEGNTYSSTGTFELDLDGKPNGVAVTSDVAPVCVNDNGACGVLVDGKIYTTVAQAAEVATAGSTVTLLHNSTETVKFPEGVTLNKNGFTAEGVTAVAAKIGETSYTTFEEALAAVQAGETLTLLADLNMSDILTINKAITLDGNGKTLTY
ncbi:MAG: right-handed parallel beta-helix repeat-containing protein, partial [Bacteroidaceae bacterium]|nr:right-handed parallel beta-helix repeat-containing protein [Bacteroidaceae bacterium]